MYVIFDIETVPAVSNYSKLSDQGKKIFEKRYKITAKKDATDIFLEKASLDSEFSSIFCVCGIVVADFNEGTDHDFFAFTQENVPLFFDMLIKLSESHGKLTFCGHNIKSFDLPMLVRYAAKYRINLAKIWDLQALLKGHRISVFDTMELFSGGVWGYKISLDALCYSMGVATPKTDLDGSMVWDYVRSGRWSEVVDYCLADCESVYELLKIYHKTI